MNIMPWMSPCWTRMTLTGGETVPKEDYDSVVRAYEELRISSEQTRMDFAEQASAVDGILQELSEISGRTASLRTDVEQGTARLTQVEMIEDNIDEIKLKLEELDRLSRDNAAYRKVVANLKNVITEKEREAVRRSAVRNSGNYYKGKDYRTPIPDKRYSLK